MQDADIDNGIVMHIPVAGVKDKLVAFFYMPEKPEMGVPVSGDDGMSSLFRITRLKKTSWTEGKRFTTCPGQDNTAYTKARHRESADGPGICPGPGFHLLLAPECFGPGRFQEELREDRLGLDIGALAYMPQAAEGEGNHQDNEEISFKA